MMPIPKNPPSISEGFSFEEIVKGIQELTILAKENTVSDPILEKESEEMSDNPYCVQQPGATRTPLRTPNQTVQGNLTAATLRANGGRKVFHFYWTGEMNDTEFVHLFVECPQSNLGSNSVLNRTFIREGSWMIDNNTFYSLSKQEARRIWDYLQRQGYACESGARPLGMTTLIKPE